MLWRRVAGPTDRRPQRQTFRLELSAENDEAEVLREYADSNSCVNFGPESPTSNPNIPSATPDVLHIVITRDFQSPIGLTSCSALSSDHLPVIIDTGCRSSFHCPPDQPDVRRTDWGNFQAQLEAKIPLNPELLNSMDIEACVGSFSCAILEALVASTNKRRPHGDPNPRPRLVYRIKYTCKTDCGDGGRSQGTPL